jgi:hypothetical protein
MVIIGGQCVVFAIEELKERVAILEQLVSPTIRGIDREPDKPI